MGGNRDGDPIESYLDELLGALRGTARDVRRTLAECEAHLRESVERGVAPEQAVASFGSIREVAASFNRAHRPASVRSVMSGLTFQVWRLSAIGLIAIGISGVIAWLTALLAGTSAVFGDAPGTHDSASACAHFLAVQPTAHTCGAAALLEARDDALVLRGAAGVLGLLLLAAWFWWKRRMAVEPRNSDLRIAAALIGLTAFGAAGLLLTGYGIDRAVINTGSGQWITSGAVALAVAMGYAVTLWRNVTSLPA